MELGQGMMKNTYGVGSVLKKLIVVYFLNVFCLFDRPRP